METSLTTILTLESLLEGISMKLIFFSLAVFAFLISGCSSKTFHDQSSGAFIDSEEIGISLEKENLFHTEDFRRYKMNEFKTFANEIYLDIEETKASAEKHSMRNKQVRDNIIYKQWGTK